MNSDWKENPEKYYGVYWKYCDDDRVLDVNGTRTRYWDTGSGAEAVILVHGYGGSAEEWAWNIPALEKKYRVIALDIPGFGLADKPDAPYTYPYFASYIAAFMDKLGISSAHVAGHSMGGAIALNLALRHPGRVRTLSLVAPAFGRKYPSGMHLITTPLLGEALFKPPASKMAIQESFRDLTHDAVRYPDITLERYYRYLNMPGYARVSLKYMRNYLSPFGLSKGGREIEKFYHENLPGLKIPVFVAWGRQDKIVDFSASGELRSLIPHAEFWELDPCGHSPHFEYPEEYNSKLADFLSRNQ